MTKGLVEQFFSLDIMETTVWGASRRCKLGTQPVPGGLSGAIDLPAYLRPAGPRRCLTAILLTVLACW